MSLHACDQLVQATHYSAHRKTSSHYSQACCISFGHRVNMMNSCCVSLVRAATAGVHSGFDTLKENMLTWCSGGYIVEPVNRQACSLVCWCMYCTQYTLLCTVCCIAACMAGAHQQLTVMDSLEVGILNRGGPPPLFFPMGFCNRAACTGPEAEANLGPITPG